METMNKEGLNAEALEKAELAYLTGYANAPQRLANAIRAYLSATPSAGWQPIETQWPLGSRFSIEHDGFTGTVIGYYRRLDGKMGVVGQLDNARIVHVYGEKWLTVDPLPPPPQPAQDGERE